MHSQTVSMPTGNAPAARRSGRQRSAACSLVHSLCTLTRALTLRQAQLRRPALAGGPPHPLTERIRQAMSARLRRSPSAPARLLLRSTTSGEPGRELARLLGPDPAAGHRRAAQFPSAGRTKSTLLCIAAPTVAPACFTHSCPQHGQCLKVMGSLPGSCIRYLKLQNALLLTPSPACPCRHPPAPHLPARPWSSGGG